MAGKTIIVAIPQGSKTLMFPSSCVQRTLVLGSATVQPPTVHDYDEVEFESDEQQFFMSTEDGRPRKRARLTTLTAEEKLNRRKLRNRVAAQSARDRKKEQINQMESKLEEIAEENRRLREENERLRNALTSRAPLQVVAKDRNCRVDGSARSITIIPSGASSTVEKKPQISQSRDCQCQTEQPQPGDVSRQADCDPPLALESAALISAPQQQGQASSQLQSVLTLLLTCLLSTPSLISSRTIAGLSKGEMEPGTGSMLDLEQFFMEMTPLQRSRIRRLNLRHADKLHLLMILRELAASRRRKKCLQ